MVVRHLLESLEEEVYQACLLVPVPGVADVDWVLSRFAAHLGVEEPSPERAALLAQIYEQMAIVREDGRHVVLIIDEADVLAERGALGDLRALLNLEYEERRLLTLVLVGPNEIQETLARERGLAARLDVHVRLRPLDAEAATQYLTHRIRRVGGSPAILDASALQVLIERAGGIPRRMNTIADNALFEAFLAGRVSATRDDVLHAPPSELGTGEATARRPRSLREPRRRPPRAPRREARRAPPPRRAAQPDRSCDSVFDAPPPAEPAARRRRARRPRRGLRERRRRSRARAARRPPPPASGRGAPDKTMILSAGEDFDIEDDERASSPHRAPSAGPPKEEEIDDLFAEIVEES